MPRTLLAVVFILASASALGQNCQQIGDQLTCDNGFSAQRIGNSPA